MTLDAANLLVNRSQKEVLHSVSFAVAAGEIYVLLGGNGAGKSTTLLAFLGFLKPSAGYVAVDGVPVFDDIAAARKNTAYLPETVSLYTHLSAEENLDYFSCLAGNRASAKNIALALDHVSLSKSDRKKKLNSFSKGMRQKVAVALAILRDTDNLLLDEPTSGLDPSAIDTFHCLVSSLAKNGKTILMVTHDIYGACQIARRVGLLRAGRLVNEFSATENDPVNMMDVRNAFALKTA